MRFILMMVPAFRRIFCRVAAIQGRVQKTLPKSSLIGVLLEHQENYTVVESSRIGIMQHDPFHGVVSEGEFQNAGHLSGGARYRSRALNDWLAALDRSQGTLCGHAFCGSGGWWSGILCRTGQFVAEANAGHAGRQPGRLIRKPGGMFCKLLGRLRRYAEELPHKTGRRQQL